LKVQNDAVTIMDVGVQKSLHAYVTQSHTSLLPGHNA
jgi:hypothetical protein